MYIDFQQNRLSRSVKTVHTNLFAQYRKLHKFATTNSNFKKKVLLDMHHHKTYMYINIQQNQVKTLQLELELELEFRKTKPFGHALPPHGHSGRF